MEVHLKNNYDTINSSLNDCVSINVNDTNNRTLMYVLCLLLLYITMLPVNLSLLNTVTV